MPRVFVNFANGLISDNPLGIGATTLTSSELADLPAVSGSDYIPITLDPDSTGGAPEIVHITAHSASATTATIARGQQGTTAREHAQSIKWRGSQYADDFERLNTIEADDWVTSPRIADGAVLPAHIDSVDAADINAGTAPIDISGEAATAARWTTARTLSLTGDVTGSVAISGTGDAAINAVVANNSHTHDDSTIDGLDGSVITTGTIANGRLPSSITGKTLVEADGFEADVDGSTSSPAFRWDSDPNTGFRRVSSGQVAVVSDGSDAAEFGNDGITLKYGTTVEAILTVENRILAGDETATPTNPGILTGRWNNTTHPNTVGVSLRYDQSATTKTWIKMEFSGAADGGSISGNGSSLNVNNPSDIRTKDVHGPIDPARAAELITELDIIDYTRHGSRRAGFNAQQVRTFPELAHAVTLGPSEGLPDFHYLAEAELLPWAIAAIKHLLAEA